MRLPSGLRSLAADQRGFALLAVTLVLAILGVVVTEFAHSMRLQAGMVRAYKDGILAQHLAEAGIQQAIREILTTSNLHGMDEDGQVLFYRTAPGTTVPQPIPPLLRTGVELGAGEFSYRITDEERRLHLNASPPDRIDRLLQALGIEKTQRDTIRDSILDWRDADDNYRIAGAESDDYYLKLPLPYRARNGNIQDVAELLQIKGVTPEIYYGAAGQPGLADFVTVRGARTINVNTAPPPVLKAAGFSDAEIADVVQARVTTPYASVPGRFANRRLSVRSSVFRIEAEGLVGGQPRARVIALVQPRSPAGATAAPTVAVLAWRSLPPRTGPDAKDADGAAGGVAKGRGSQTGTPRR